jgi:hypothetical protein
LENLPHFFLRSCRTSTWWCKRHLERSEVLIIYGISDIVALGVNPDLNSNIIDIQPLTPVKIILSAAFAVIKEVQGRVG